eukprot:850523-Pelagomonas_calceolata.AAC.1
MHGKRNLEVVCLSSLPISILTMVGQACSQRAFAKSFNDHSSNNVVASSFHAGDDMISGSQFYHGYLILREEGARTGSQTVSLPVACGKQGSSLPAKTIKERRLQP